MNAVAGELEVLNMGHVYVAFVSSNVHPLRGKWTAESSGTEAWEQKKVTCMCEQLVQMQLEDNIHAHVGAVNMLCIAHTYMYINTYTQAYT